MRNIPLGVSAYHSTTRIGCIRPTDPCSERGGGEVALLLSCGDMMGVHAGKLEKPQPWEHFSKRSIIQKGAKPH